MKSIGIYGDSFAGMINSLEYKPTHWASLIAKHYDAPLTNYSQPGSSVYFSYNEFLKNYSKHDLNIFCATEPTRYHNKVKTLQGEDFIGGISGCDISLSPSPKDLRGWFICQSTAHSTDMAELMIDRIRSLDSNVIIIPSFRASFTKKYAEDLGLEPEHNLQQFILLQISMYGFRNYNQFMLQFSEGELVTGHLFPESNEIFFSILKDRIDTGVWNWEFPTKLNLKYTIDRYYERKIT